ncbi:MAG: hypothetical protein K6B73_06965 [Treponema sp.]|nr:hypothetical protein [Treponema sp.]
MKKIIAAALITLAFTLTVFAENAAGFGINYTSTKVEIQDYDNIKQNEAGIQGFYYHVSDTGRFALKTTLDLGVAESDLFEDWDCQYMGILLGLGIAAIKQPAFNLAIFTTIGIDYANYSREEEVSGTTLDLEANNLDLTLGLDVLAKFRFAKHFGMYADFNVRALAGTFELSRETHTVKTTVSYDNTGFAVEPSVGVCWTF